MTGFGQAELKSPSGSIRVELKSTNHKFLEISTRLPGHLAEQEEELRKRIATRLNRGKIFVFASAPDPAVYSSRLVLNEALAKEVSQKARRVQKLLGLKDVSEDAMLREVLRYPDVLTKDTSAERAGADGKRLARVVDQALANLDRSRAAEGQALLKDLKNRVREVRAALSAIEKRLPAIAREFKRTLEKRSQEFLKNGETDRDRMTQEVAQYLKSADISEEVTRLTSHLDAMAKTLSEKGELGRKIDFIAQEMTRETNTIGAKSSDVAIAEQVIRIKAAIEKIREQAQNVE
jgi:uncharacterized protein (TIGR00255 family)